MPTRPRLILALIGSLLFACGPAPTPVIVAGGPSPPAMVAVAVGDPPPATEPEEPFVEDGDPGPVPVHASDPSWGRRDAPVTIVEWADFQCPFSQRAVATLAELRLRYGPEKLRIVWKNNPLSFHDKARRAAVVAMALHDRFGDDAFWRAHDAFYGDQMHLADRIADEAGRAGLSMDDVDAMAAGREGSRLDASSDEAKRLGAPGTPAFFINGVYLGGAQPAEKFAAIIDEQLGKAAALLARGTPRHRLYVELAKAERRAAKPPEPRPPEKPDLTIYAVPVGKSPVRGKPTARVTIVEIAEFQCPFCGRVQPTLQQVQAKYGDQVRLVWKHNPLPFHPHAAPAAELAIEARAQRGDAAFWKVHDILFSSECSGNPKAQSRADCESSSGKWVDHQTKLDDADLLDVARSLGLDAKRVADAIGRKKHAAEIEADQALADDVQANGTPHFFINGRRLVGAQPLEKFTALIDEELAKADALVRGGVAPAQVYDRVQAAAQPPPPPQMKVIPPPTRDNPSRGPANARVVVQFFSDFQCPFCARVRGTLEDLEKAFPGQIRLVWRNHPLPMHPDAEPAAEAAMEAFRQKGDKGFWAMYELLYAGQAQSGGLGRKELEAYAAELGLNAAQFANALDGSAHKAIIDADAKVATDAGIQGTPAFVINGYFVSGAQPLGKLKKVVSRALAGK